MPVNILNVFPENYLLFSLPVSQCCDTWHSLQTPFCYYVEQIIQISKPARST